jgi:hypothetical protein
MVFDQQRHRCAGRFAADYSRQDLGMVSFDLHPSAATVSALATRKVAVDCCRVDWNPGREAVHDCGQTAPM